MAGIFTRVKSEPKFDNTYLAAKKQIYKFQLEQLLRTLRSACSREYAVYWSNLGNMISDTFLTF